MRQTLKNFSQMAPVLLFVIGMAGCSSSNIRSDYDHTADFGSYKTYDFIEGAGPDYEGYESLFTQYMITAITLEMEKRGYVKSDNPDLYVNFNVNTQDKTKVTQTSSAASPYYGYRGGFYDPWGGYGYGTQTHVSQYTEGTFNIDIIDVKKHQLIWEAVSAGRITDKVRKNLQKIVMEGVPEFFTYYPFIAGDPNPVQAD